MKLRNYIKQHYIRLTTFKWRIGIAEYHPDLILDSRKKMKIHWIKNPSKACWFADPFILSENSDYLHILVEEYFYANHKGRISKLVVNRHNWALEKITPILDLSTHLSFPAYYREGDNIYLYPENTQSGKLILYKYDPVQDTAIPVRVISTYPLADAVIFDIGERKLILATTAPNDNGRVLDVYPLLNDPSIGPEQRIAFPTRVARNAGFPFRIGNRIIRPAQDCSRQYGSCVVLQEMSFHDSQIKFREIKRLHSPLFFYPVGFHTFNVFEDKLVAVDAEGFRFGYFAQLAYRLRELLK